MPVCMSICVAATGSATPFQSAQISPCDRAALTTRRKPLMLFDSQSQGDSVAPDIVSSSSTTGFAGRVRLRPDAVYVQLGDVDAPGARCMRIVHVGDAAWRTGRGGAAELAGRIPDGDVLVHSGGGFVGSAGCGSSGGSSRRSLRDRFGSLLTPLMRQRELQRLRDLLSTLPHRHKILVPSGGTSLAQKELQQLFGSACHFLCDSTVTLEGVTFYGMSSKKSTTKDGCQDDAPWRDMPTDLEATVDVLVSHSPPRDQELAREVFQRIRPKALLQGHSSATDVDYPHWQDGVLLANGRLDTRNGVKASPSSGSGVQREFNKPVVIDFYTCRPMSGVSQQYSEVMQTLGSNQNRLKKQSGCSLL